MVELFTIFVLVLLLLLEGPKMWSWTLGQMSPGRQATVTRIAADVSQKVTGYMAGNLLTSLTAGTVVFVTLLILGVTEDSASADSTGSATSLRIRSTAIAVASSGGPKTSRFSAWPARPSGAGGVSGTLVAWIGGSCPSAPATGTNRVNRAGRTLLASGCSPRDGSAGSACRHTCGSADTRSHSRPISRRAAS